MPKAARFHRQNSFALFSAEQPNTPHSGVSLDAEFNAVKLAMDETQQNLARIQDDDGVLKRGSVGRAQLDASAYLDFAAPSTWQPGATYDANVSTVFFTSKFYIATVSHVSGDTFDPSFWEEIADYTVAAIIDDGSITSAKLAADAVGAGKVADGSISNIKMASGAVSTSKLAVGAITADKMADAAITLAKLNLTGLADALFPAGLGPLPWSLPTLPAGWDWADGGALLPDTAYPVLRAAYIADGFPFGQDGSGNPRKPDTRGRSVAGPDGGSARLPGYGFATAGGSSTVTLTVGQLPAHNHGGATSFDFPDHTHETVVADFLGLGGQVGNGLGSVGNRNAVSSGASARHAHAIASQGGGGAHSNIQPTLALPMIIKAH